MKRVLIVEDVSETRRWLADILHSAFGDCDIREAASVRAGVEEGTAGTFDLALIDLGLPDGSGSTCYARSGLPIRKPLAWSQR